MSGLPPVPLSVAWYDIEDAAYEADLELWAQLAAELEGPVLELGCGAGRVSLHLARLGHRVTGIDLDPERIAALEERGGELPAKGWVADACSFRLEQEFGLALAPLHFIQLLADRSQRIDCLRRTAAHLAPGGRVALSLVGELISLEGGFHFTTPDRREIEDWIFLSRDLGTRLLAEEIVVCRHREAISPDRVAQGEEYEARLQALSPADLEGEGAEAGLRPCGRHHVPETLESVGSTVVVLEREA